MTTLAEEFREFLLGDNAVSTLFGERIHQAVVPESSRDIYPRLWFRRAQVDDELDLGGEGGLPQTMFDVECLTDNLEQLDELVDAVRDRLHGYPPAGTDGTWGVTPIRGVFCEDQSDDYIPFGVGDDEGTHFAALSVTVIHAT